MTLYDSILFSCKQKDYLFRFDSGVYLCIANNKVQPSVSKRVSVIKKCLKRKTKLPCVAGLSL